VLWEVLAFSFAEQLQRAQELLAETAWSVERIARASGFGYLGSPADVAPPQDVTSEALAEALTHHDPIKKYRPVVAEPSVIQCPLKTQVGSTETLGSAAS
jgi:hypothetical protein